MWHKLHLQNSCNITYPRDIVRNLSDLYIVNNNNNNNNNNNGNNKNNSQVILRFSLTF